MAELDFGIGDGARATSEWNIYGVYAPAKAFVDGDSYWHPGQTARSVKLYGNQI